MQDTIVKALAGAAAGAVIGWAGTALTLTGRVAAIEASQARTEAAIERIAAKLAERER
ncbi:MAG: hypothetical protein QM788_15095 [Roseateles sp.]|uniref:hypothetical protein n=1 Tax=Roseateles sp. TaxID=1971397 RepID=UPI0039EA57BE